jgi:hypothetical protein
MDSQLGRNMGHTTVLYHSNCYDGFGAAWAAHKALGDSPKYIPVGYNTEPPVEALTGCEKLYIVDFSYPAETIMKLADGRPTIVLDHHKTAEAALKDLNHPNLEIVFDMERSGAGITWDYFHKTVRPQLINHIEDRDLWRFKLDRSKEIHAALVSYPFDFKIWDSFNIEQLKTEGVALTRMYASLVEKICKHPWFEKIGEHTVPVVNTTIAWSEVGEFLRDKYPEAPFVASFTEFEDCVMWSLRSKDNFDVSVVAKQFGGGGHKNAAGFKIFRKRM